MNIRKNIDYNEMYEDLDHLMAQELSQMELYCEIGKAVCQRAEKGAAVMASEYLNKRYPDVKGFSPRSLRRMRDFFHTYENHPVLLSRAMELGWIQNVVIMEAELTMELREWYMKAVKQFDWSKTKLIANIAENAHENIVLAIEDEVCYIVEKEEKQASPQMEVPTAIKNVIHYEIRRTRKRWLIWKGGGRRWWNRFHAMLKKIQFSEDDIPILLGDVIDRGPDGIALLLESMEMPNVIMLLGNHEHMMLQYFSPEATSTEIHRWNKNGNAPTLAAYLKQKAEVQKRLLAYLWSLPTHLDMEVGGKRFYLVHGFPGGNVHDEVWTRPTMESENPIPDCRLIIGHTKVLSMIQPEDKRIAYAMELEER